MLSIGAIAVVAVIAFLASLHGDVWYHFVGEPSVRNKTVLVTGASMGIGAALVKEYAKKGASDIIMASRSVGKMEVIRDEIYAAAESNGTGTNTKIHILKADLSSKEASEDCVASALQLLGEKGLDYLVLNHITNSRFGTFLVDNAALPGGHGFVPEMFNTNTLSYIYMTAASMEALQKSSGQIVVISSLAGWVGPPKTAVYSATKHAIQGFFDSLRVEFKMLGIENVGITIASLGAHDTEGASEVKKQMDAKILTWEPPADAARAVVRAAAVRKREMFYPASLVYPVLAMRPFFPALVDWMLMLPYAK